MMHEEQLKILKGIKADFCRTFNTDEGQRVLQHLKDTCFEYTSTFDSKDENNRTIFVNEGKRQVLLTIKNMLELDVEKIAKIQKEDLL